MEISEIRKHLSAETVGEKLLVFDEVGSTNDVLRELTGEGSAADGTVVVSDSQTAGRGRLGRKWVSPRGVNLYLSALFRPDIPARQSPVFTFLASCALVEVFSGYGVDAEIKWPNDILVGGRKISGVLTELGASGGSVDYLVIGIGVNLNLTGEFIRGEMEDISEKTTSLSILLGEDVSRERFCAELVNVLDRFYGEFRRRGTRAIVDMWVERWGLIGKEISVDVSGEVVSGGGGARRRERVSLPQNRRRGPPQGDCGRHGLLENPDYFAVKPAHQVHPLIYRFLGLVAYVLFYHYSVDSGLHGALSVPFRDHGREPVEHPEGLSVPSLEAAHEDHFRGKTLEYPVPQGRA